MFIKLLEVSVWVTAHLLWFACMLLAMTSLGAPWLRKVVFHSRLERGIFTLGLGAGLAALLLFALGVTGLLGEKIIWVATAIGCLVTLIRYARTPRESRREVYLAVKQTVIKHPLFVLGAAGYWILLLLTTQYPPMDWDATMYHLVLARQYLNDGQILLQPGAIFPILPLLNHMLFVWGLALHDDILAQMVEHLFLLLVAGALFAWGQRQRSEWLGLTAAAFWLAHPLILWLSETAYVDLGLTCFVFLGVYALRVFWDDGAREWWWLGLTLLGFAAGSKLPGMVFFSGASVLAVLAWWRARLTVKQLLLSAGFVLLLIAPWYALIGKLSGNPFWPMFAERSSGLWGDKSTVTALRIWIDLVGVPKTLTNFLLAPVYMIYQPAPFLPDNRLPLFPLIGVWGVAWAVAWWNRSVRWWSLWALMFTGFWFFSSQQLRLWVPAIPLAILAFCESVQWLASRNFLARFIPAPRYVDGFCVVFIVVAFWFGGVTVKDRIRAKGLPPTRMEDRESYLRNIWAHFAAVEYVNNHLTGNDAVYVIQASWLNYYFKTRVVDASGILQQVIQPKYNWPADERWLKWLNNQRVGWIFISTPTVPEAWRTAQQNQPSFQPVWPGWKLVFTDAQAWVFQRTQGY